MKEGIVSELEKEGIVVLRISGKLDVALSSALETKAVHTISAGCNKLVFDFTDVSYINSAGLRMLLSIKKQMKAIPGKFIVCNLRPEVLEVMKICGFDHVLEISESEEEALRRF